MTTLLFLLVLPYWITSSQSIVRIAIREACLANGQGGSPAEAAADHSVKDATVVTVVWY